jgi:antitoxin component YwqK of YwqJK toxin-antitoxin module
MKKILLPILLLLLFSCGKKRQVIEQGNSSPENYDNFSNELYIENDSAFHVYTNLKNGKLVEMDNAASLEELKDSTYCRIYYYHESGNLHSIDYFRKKKREGESTSFYESGKKKSRASFVNGIKGNYEAWYESGNVMVKGELLPDSTFRHREYFENGNPKKEMLADKNGKGSCTYYYSNGKVHETGALLNFDPTGIWKIFDTLGNLKQDTLFGIK